jgi:hypothetical protein
MGRPASDKKGGAGGVLTPLEMKKKKDAEREAKKREEEEGRRRREARRKAEEEKRQVEEKEAEEKRSMNELWSAQQLRRARPGRGIEFRVPSSSSSSSSPSARGQPVEFVYLVEDTPAGSTRIKVHHVKSGPGAHVNSLRPTCKGIRLQFHACWTSQSAKRWIQDWNKRGLGREEREQLSTWRHRPSSSNAPATAEPPAASAAAPAASDNLVDTSARAAPAAAAEATTEAAESAPAASSAAGRTSAQALAAVTAPFNMEWALSRQVAADDYQTFVLAEPLKFDHFKSEPIRPIRVTARVPRLELGRDNEGAPLASATSSALSLRRWPHWRPGVCRLGGVLEPSPLAQALGRTWRRPHGHLTLAARATWNGRAERSPSTSPLPLRPNDNLEKGVGPGLSRRGEDEEGGVDVKADTAASGGCGAEPPQLASHLASSPTAEAAASARGSNPAGTPRSAHGSMLPWSLRALVPPRKAPYNSPRDGGTPRSPALPGAYVGYETPRLTTKGVNDGMKLLSLTPRTPGRSPRSAHASSNGSPRWTSHATAGSAFSGSPRLASTPRLQACGNEWVRI